MTGAVTDSKGSRAGSSWVWSTPQNALVTFWYRQPLIYGEHCSNTWALCQTNTNLAKQTGTVLKPLVPDTETSPHEPFHWLFPASGPFSDVNKDELYWTQQSSCRQSDLQRLCGFFLSPSFTPHRGTAGYKPHCRWNICLHCLATELFQLWPLSLIQTVNRSNNDKMCLPGRNLNW